MQRYAEPARPGIYARGQLSRHRLLSLLHGFHCAKLP